MRGAFFALFREIVECVSMIYITACAEMILSGGIIMAEMNELSVRDFIISRRQTTLGEEVPIIVDMYRGSLLSRKEMLALIEGCEKYYEGISDDQIIKHNEEKEKAVYDEWVRRNEETFEKVVPPKRKGKKGYIYVIKEHFTGTYKIGRTTNLKSRSSTFGVILPFDWDFVYVFYGNNHEKIEDMLHDKFSEKRVDGEWFSLSSDDLLFFEKEIIETSSYSDLNLEVVPCPVKNV